MTHTVAASPAEVWSVLADGWVYATWVVGACRIRSVDPGWPAVGTEVHHSFGIWPLVINDDTTVLSATPEQELVLTAQGWPIGEATVRLVLTPEDGGTTLTLQEDATAGPGRLVPKPVRQLGLLPRNKESLRRLGFLAEGRRREHATRPARA
ncbi:MAG TPA: SRPBCC family protein [Mycobacteriales bacterium]|nr:SRPBCC family protein [Mycobacteriales bacterium]